MRGDWDYKPLGEVCDIVGGGTPSQKNAAFYVDGTIPWATVRDMKDEIMCSTERNITADAVAACATNIIARDNVVIATRVGLGKVCLLKQDTAINQDLRGILPRKPNEIEVRFLFRWFQSIADAIESAGTGMTVKGVTLPFIKALHLPLPPLLEQKRIVAILDEAFAGINATVANAEKNVSNARELFKSYLDAAFVERKDTDPRYKLTDLCHSDRVITYGVIKLGDDVKDGVPCLRTSNVRWLHIDTKGIKCIAPSLSAEFARTVLRSGEVLVNVRGTLGGVAVATPEMAGWNVSREVAVVPLDPSLVIPRYLAYWIGTGTSQGWLGGVKKGVAYVGINIEDLRNLPVPVPPLVEQGEIVARLDELHTHARRLEETYRQRLVFLNHLKQSILQKAFAGELTAKEAQREVAAA